MEAIHTLQNILDSHLLAAMEGVGGVAPGAAQVASSQAHEDARQACAGSLTLDRFEYFRDVHRIKKTCRRYCPPVFAFFPDRLESQ
jgi:hypothetical protein